MKLNSTCKSKERDCFLRNINVSEFHINEWKYLVWYLISIKISLYKSYLCTVDNEFSFFLYFFKKFHFCYCSVSDHYIPVSVSVISTVSYDFFLFKYDWNFQWIQREAQTEAPKGKLAGLLGAWARYFNVLSKASINSREIMIFYLCIHC